MIVTDNFAKWGGGGIYNVQDEHHKGAAFLDDFTVAKLIDNKPNNYQGRAYIPA